MRALIFAAAAVAAGAAYAEPVAYTLDPAHTQVAFSLDRLGFNHVLGQFDTVSGEIVLDEANPAASSVRATVQIGSISTGNATRDEHLRAERWLNAAAFPTAEFRSTAVRIIDGNRAEVTGALTLFGQTHPLTLNVTLNRIGAAQNGRRTAGFSIAGTLMRSTWGSSNGLPHIGDAVSLQIEALAQAPAP